MMAETVPEEMAENVTKEGAETEIVTVKMAETKEVVKSVESFQFLSFFSREKGGGNKPKKKKKKIGLEWL